jgi:uncharacterized membrane protein YqiK
VSKGLESTDPIPVLALLLVLLVACVVLASMLPRLVCIARPSEALVIAGRSRRRPDGSVVNYRIVESGRTLRLPLVEAAHAIDLRPFTLRFEVRSAHDEVTPIRAAAVVQISREPSRLARGVEHFLGMPRERVVEAAQQVLDTFLRQATARFDATQLNEERRRHCDELERTAQEGLDRLGMDLAFIDLEGAGAEP